MSVLFNGDLDGILFVHNYYHGKAEKMRASARNATCWPGRGQPIVEYSRCSGEIALNGISSRIKLGVAALCRADLQ